MMKGFMPLTLCFAIFSAVSCGDAPEAPYAVAAGDLIPRPLSIKDTGAAPFILNKNCQLIVDAAPESNRIAQWMALKLRPATGFLLPVNAAPAARATGNIELNLKGDSSLGAEGYELKITDSGIIASASSAAGLFYACQSILQLLPADIYRSTVHHYTWKIPAAHLRDQPEYGYRGAMLDVARHFFEVEEVKQFIDRMVAYKMNALHLHLSDDQGWRIEIKSWPNLTAQGGSTEVGGGKGGFYTQEQYKDLVNYAADRFVVIIPEIDMPGHTNAALASYPELNCNDSATKLYSGTDVGFSSLCTKKEITYKFIDDVFGELAALTPGPYLHIGGDESHATSKEDYIPFVNRVQEIVKKHNKQVIGWDEIAIATLQPNTIAQYWADSANSANAVKQGARIIMSPAKKAYLDMQYDSTSKYGLHWAAYIEVNTGYNWDPAGMVAGIGKEQIHGIEAPLWSETVSDLKESDYLVFPRLLGYAEIGWSATSGNNWTEYRQRLARQAPRFNVLGIQYYESALVDWVK